MSLADDIEMLYGTYTQLRWGETTTFACMPPTGTTELKKALVRGGLRDGADFVLEKTEDPYPGVNGYLLARVTERVPDIRLALHTKRLLRESTGMEGRGRRPVSDGERALRLLMKLLRDEQAPLNIPVYLPMNVQRATLAALKAAVEFLSADAPQ